LRGDAPLFPAPKKRDGYFNPDPSDPIAVARTLFDITDMVGEFEKPRYVEYEQWICAHSRNGIVACSRCLDNCPTGAIVPQGDGVSIDPYVCAGCGNCASVCPTGAVRYAMPESESLLLRLRTLIKAYAAGGGRRPVLLVHDGQSGEEMIAAIARHYDGLPANVLPVAVNAVGQCGLEMLMAARVYGAAATLLLAPASMDDDLAGLNQAADLSNQVLDALGYDSGRAEIVSARDPEALAARLRAVAASASDGPQADEFTPAGGKRDLLSLALAALHHSAPTPVDEIALAKGAPFGTVDVNVDGCTLCMACAGVCPANALRDSPDHPRLSFVEMACVQCGLCEKTCPEKVIALRPRLNFTAKAREPRIIKDEEPFRCVRCGKPFATKSMVLTIQQRMATHNMFAKASALRRILMCADCRVIDMAETGDNPFAIGPRPPVRTTDDFLRERERGTGDDDETS
jgi:ferredoxin